MDSTSPRTIAFDARPQARYDAATRSLRVKRTRLRMGTWSDATSRADKAEQDKCVVAAMRGGSPESSPRADESSAAAWTREWSAASRSPRPMSTSPRARRGDDLASARASVVGAGPRIRDGLRAFFLSASGLSSATQERQRWDGRIAGRKLIWVIRDNCGVDLSDPAAAALLRRCGVRNPDDGITYDE
jgi:hypothetical protein